jgi:hypothetical protein
MNKVEIGIFFVLAVAAVTVTAAATTIILTAQPAHASCITGKSGATICSDGSAKGASGSTISNGCATGVTGKTVC